jgi:transcriptional regulator with XRE-family HTH domain
MSTDPIDLERLGERLAVVRKAYDESIDLPNLGPNLFATLLGVSVSAYESYERGERQPTIDFLIALRKKTGVSLDWLLDLDQRMLDPSFWCGCSSSIEPFPERPIMTLDNLQ